MAWTQADRDEYRREEELGASGMRDAEWALIPEELPSPARRGRPRTVDLRAVVEALLFVLTTGCQWRALPRGAFPPRSTVQGYVSRWRRDGTWRGLRERLVERARRLLTRRLARLSHATAI